MLNVKSANFDMSQLWEIADSGKLIPLSSFDTAIQECLLEGDGVYDHYGCRSNFLVLEARGSRVLILELLKSRDFVRPINAINATGGYSTGILGGEIANLKNAFATTIQTAACTNDEHQSLERSRLVKKLLYLVAEHTQTKVNDWNLTFTSTGTEAMDFALQLLLLEAYSLQKGKDFRESRNVLIACQGAWHGWGLGVSQLLDRRQFTDGLPRLAGFKIVFVPYGNIHKLEEAFSKYRGAIRGIFAEGVLGDGGIVRANEDWWNKVLKLAREEDARVIVDEILTGFRCGGILAIPPGIIPDCITLGKGLGFGVFPLSAVIWRKSFTNPRPGIGVRTFNARPFQAKIAEVGIDYIINNKLFEYSVELGEYLIDSLRYVVSKFPDVYKSVRGQGLLVGVELANSFGSKGKIVRDSIIHEGVLVETESGLKGRHIPRTDRINQTIRMTPPLVTPKEEVPKIVECFESAARTLMNQLL